MNHPPLLCNLLVTKVHVRTDTRYLLLCTNHRFVTARDVTNVVQQVVEQLDLRVYRQLIILHPLGNLSLHQSYVVLRHASQSGLCDLRLDLFFDLGEFNALSIFVEEL